MASGRKVKLEFDVNANDWHGCASESLWAEEIDARSSTAVLRLCNSPFFATGVSLDDVVKGILIPGTFVFKFAGIVEHSGHSTYVILCSAPKTTWNKYWKPIEALGCSYESGTIGKQSMYSVDVPKETDIYEVYSLLAKGESDEAWTFQESHVGHRLDLKDGQSDHLRNQ
jgi:hypothetical protein